MIGQHFSRLVTLKIPGMVGGNKSNQFQFVDQADIRYARTIALEYIPGEAMQYAQPEPLPIFSAGYLPLLSLTLETNDPDDPTDKAHPDGIRTNSPGRFSSTTQTQKWIPCSSINRTQVQIGNTIQPFVRQLLQYENLYITWQKSFLNVGGSGFNNTVDMAFCLLVWYTFIDIHGKNIQRT